MENVNKKLADTKITLSIPEICGGVASQPKEASDLPKEASDLLNRYKKTRG